MQINETCFEFISSAEPKNRFRNPTFNLTRVTLSASGCAHLQTAHHWLLSTLLSATKAMARALLLFLLVSSASGQLIRPISIPGIFSMIRFQNTACQGDQDEAGTCLYEVSLVPLIAVPLTRPRGRTSVSAAAVR